jgi:NADPH:quinone reductase-like Zn-dependent oxidoreductase
MSDSRRLRARIASMDVFPDVFFRSKRPSVGLRSWTVAMMCGVGQYVIALARAGIRTLAVVRRDEAAKQARKLGADVVVLDGENLGDRVAEALGGAQLRRLLEGRGSAEQVGELVRSVEAGGSVVTFASPTGQAPALPLGDLIYRETSLRAFFIFNWLRDTPRPELVRVYGELADLVESGVLQAAVEATYPLRQHREAIAHAVRPERAGKVLFTPNQPVE